MNMHLLRGRTISAREYGRRGFFAVFLWAIMSCLFVVGCGRRDAGAGVKSYLVVPGTGASEVILSELAVAFNASNDDVEVQIPPSSGSSGGIRLVGEGEEVLGRVARTIKDKEAHYGLSYLVFAKDTVVFAVGKRVDIASLTVEQLARIYSGHVDNWQEVGGSAGPIGVLTRESADSSLELIRKNLEFFGDLEITEDAKLLYHDHEMVSMLGKYSRSIGLGTASSIAASSDSRAIAIDGVEPTAENVLSGKYELVIDYAFVYKHGGLSEDAKRFIDFVFSSEGRSLLEGRGLIAVDRR